MSEAWKGLIVRWDTQDTLDTGQICFLETPCGMIPFWMTQDEMVNVEASSPAAFDKSDAEERAQ
jgi:hypothetical protein